jgi:hypothetical protein
MATSEPVLIELDSRRRATLGRLGQGKTRFLATEDPDGSITLIPAVVVSELEARFHEQPQAVTRALQGTNPDTWAPAGAGDEALGL